MTKPVLIYSLTDPTTQQVFYVGQTTNLAARFANHLSTGRRNHKTAYAQHIRKLLAINQFPTMQHLETTDIVGKKPREESWVKHFESLGAPLTNIVYTERAKIVNAAKVEARKAKAEARAAANRARRAERDALKPAKSVLGSPEHREKLRVAALNRSFDWTINSSKAQKARWAAKTPEERAAIKAKQSASAKAAQERKRAEKAAREAVEA